MLPVMGGFQWLTLHEISSSERPQLRVGRPATRLVIAAPVLAAALFFGACGGPSSSPSASSTTTTVVSPSGANGSLAAYEACMKAHGVTIAGPGVGGFGRPSGAIGPSGATRYRGASGAIGARPSASGVSGPTRALPSGMSSATYEAAERACASLRPSGASGAFPSSAQLEAYENCLRLNGVSLPTGPTGPSGGFGARGASGAMGRGLFGLNTSNPTVKAAMAACAALLPSGMSGALGRTGAPRPSGG